MDWYNPQKNAFGIMMGTPRRSADIAKEESRNALNFMIMEKDTFNEKILNSNDNLQKNTAQQKIVVGYRLLLVLFWTKEPKYIQIYHAL